jgi:hypothetical protein
MSLGILHDGDSMHVMRTRMKLHGICDEMADAAAAVLKRGGDYEEAEKSAEEILLRNSGNGMEWELEIMGNTIKVKVRTGELPLRGVAPESPLHIEYQTSENLAS